MCVKLNYSCNCLFQIIHTAVFFFNFILWQMRNDNSVLRYRGQLKEHVLRAKVPLRAPHSQDKVSAWPITIKGRWVTPLGFTFAPAIHLDDKTRTARSRLKTYKTASITTVQHVNHTVIINGPLLLYPPLGVVWIF